jgi:hypothetical protein
MVLSLTRVGGLALGSERRVLDISVGGGRHRAVDGVLKWLDSRGAGYYPARTWQGGLGTALSRVDMGNPG